MFIEKVTNLREYQKRWFQFHNKYDLTKSIQYEHEIDKLLKEFPPTITEEEKTTQLEMFK